MCEIVTEDGIVIGISPEEILSGGEISKVFHDDHDPEERRENKNNDENNKFREKGGRIVGKSSLAKIVPPGIAPSEIYWKAREVFNDMTEEEWRIITKSRKPI